MADDSKVTETEEVDETEEIDGIEGAESEETEGAEDLGDKGKKALDTMKGKWRAERDRAKALEAQIAKQNAPKADEDKPDLEALRTQAREEARAEALKDKALDRIEAKAAKLFADPEDARRYLADNVDDFIDGQSVDNEAILEALEELLKKKPYLGVAQGDTKRFQGSGDQGTKGSAGAPQLTLDQVKKMAAEGKHEQIEAARVAGQLKNLGY